MKKDKYIKELEKALIFMCESYVAAKDSLASCRENDDGQANNKYADLWFSFPVIQGSQNIWAIEKIASLRTERHNREANTISLEELFNEIHKGRFTKQELDKKLKKAINKI